MAKASSGADENMKLPNRGLIAIASYVATRVEIVI